MIVCVGVWIIDRESRQQNSIRSMLPGLVGGGLLALLDFVPALRAHLASVGRHRRCRQSHIRL